MRIARLLIVFTLSWIGAAAVMAQMETPIGGWRQGDPEAPYTQTVNYPANSPGIDDGTPESNQIRGLIRVTTKQPATLVVNGNAMPLLVDESGMYARPYSFGSGSNSIEVRANDVQQRVQFYQLQSGQPQARLRIVLSWDTDGTDLDLHVLTPGGGHAWYGERVIPAGSIDTDVTTGFGPEIFSSAAPEKGLYQIYVNYYGGGQSSAITTARMAVITAEGTADEKRQEFTVPLRFSGELTRICQFVHP